MKALKVGRELLCCFTSVVILFGFVCGDAAAGLSFGFCLQIEGTTKCYDVHKGPVDENLPGDQLLFGAQLNTQANANFVTAVNDTLKFSIAHDIDYLQIINTSSAHHEWRSLDFHPLTMRMIPGSPSASPQLYVLGVNVSAQCNMEHQLVLHYLVFSDDYCNIPDTQKHWCPSSPHSRTLSVNRSCSLPWPSFIISQDGGGGVALVYENSHSKNLFCYNLESGSQCSYTLGELPMGYSIVAVHPYKEETIILQIKYLVTNGYQYKCYNFGSRSGLRDISDKCSTHAPMVTPSTFQSKSGSILHYNAKLQSKFEEFDDVTCDPIEFDHGQGLVYCSGTSVVTIKRPDLPNGEQTLTTPHPICKDGNSAYIWITDDGKQLAMLLCPTDQYRYLLGIVEQNGTYQFVEIHAKSSVISGQISEQTSFFRGGIYVVHQQLTPPGSPTVAPLKQNNIIITVSSILAAAISIVVFSVCVGCIVRFVKRRRRHSRLYSPDQDEGRRLMTGALRGTTGGSETSSASGEQLPLDLRLLESTLDESAINMRENSVTGPLRDHFGVIAERQREEVSPNAATGTQQTTLPSSHKEVPGGIPQQQNDQLTSTSEGHQDSYGAIAKLQGHSEASSTVSNKEQLPIGSEKNEPEADIQDLHTGNNGPSGRQQLLPDKDGVDCEPKEVSHTAPGTQQTTLTTSHAEVPGSMFPRENEPLTTPSQDSSKHQPYFGEIAVGVCLSKTKLIPERPQTSGEDETDSSSSHLPIARHREPDGN